MQNEAALIGRIKNGDDNAMEEIVKLYKKKVYFLAYDLMGNQADAEDLVQDVFLKAYSSIKRFRGDSRFSTWLYRITVNRSIDLRRRKANVIINDSEELDEQVFTVDEKGDSGTEDPHQQFNNAEIAEHIRRALRNVSPREKTAFVLKHFNELPIAEVANVMGVSAGTVKSLLFRAVQKLRKELAYFNDSILTEEAS